MKFSKGIITGAFLGMGLAYITKNEPLTSQISRIKNNFISTKQDINNMKIEFNKLPEIADEIKNSIEEYNNSMSDYKKI